MSYVPTISQLQGNSYEAASCFGMPHFQASYRNSKVRSNQLETFAECAVCGEAASNSHHEPPLGMGGRNSQFTLATPNGQFILRPALIALCGSGTTGCHGMRHNGQLKFRWAWDRDYFAEQWWNGYLLSHGLEPHSPELYGMGAWLVIQNGETVKTIRG